MEVEAPAEEKNLGRLPLPSGRVLCELEQVAGRGITHSKRFDRLRQTGGSMHGIQAWVGLPTADEETDPAFAHHGAEDLPSYEEGGLWGRLIAGEAFGAKATPSLNPYWDVSGRTFEDPDGYRIVLQNAAWPL